MALNELQLSLLTDEQRERYSALESLFEHPGWKIVTEYALAGATAQAQRALNASNWNEHQLATGARLAYTQVAGLPEVTDVEFSNIAAEVAATKEDEDELAYE